MPPRPINAYLRDEEENEDELAATREKFRDKLRSGALDNRRVEIEVDENSSPSLEMFTPQGVEEVGINIKEMLPGLFGRKKKQQVSVAEAREILQQQESEKLIDRSVVSREARERVEQGGLSSSTRSTRSPAAKGAAAPTSRARGCSATCCRSSRGPTSRPSTAW